MYRAAFFSGAWPGFPGLASPPGGEEPPESIDPPILTLTSGTANPPVFTREIPASAGEGDFLQRRIDTVDTYDSGDEREEERLITWDGTDFVLVNPTTFDVEPFTIQDGLVDGEYFISERFRRNLGDIQLYSDWSEDVEATLVSLGVTSILLKADTITTGFGYGLGPGEYNTPIAIEEGDKIQLDLVMWFNGNQTITSVTANGGALTFTQVGHPGDDIGGTTGAANDYLCYTFYADTTGITEINNIRVAVSSSTKVAGMAIYAIRGAAAGPPASSSRRFILLSNPNPIDIDQGLTLLSDQDVMNITLSCWGDSEYNFYGVTEYPDGQSLAPGEAVVTAYQKIPANATIGGSGDDGPAYSWFANLVTIWEAS